MPRTNPGNRRKDKAAELLKRLKTGPSLSFDTFGIPKDPKEIDRAIMIWLNSWITPVVCELVPELKGRE
jgi:hypothetical protein